MPLHTQFPIGFMANPIVFKNSSPSVIAPTLSNELLTNPGNPFTFSSGNPTGWTISESPPGYEVTEVDAGQGHGGTQITGGYSNLYTLSTNSQPAMRQNILSLSTFYQFQININNVADPSVSAGDQMGGTTKAFTSSGTNTWTGIPLGVLFQITCGAVPADVTIASASVKSLSNILVTERSNVSVRSWGYNYWNILLDRQAGGFLRFDTDDYILWFIDRNKNKANLYKVIGGVASSIASANITYASSKAIGWRSGGLNTWIVVYDTPDNIIAYSEADWSSHALINTTNVTNTNTNLKGNRYQFGAFSTDIGNIPQTHYYHSLSNPNGETTPLPNPAEFSSTNAAAYLTLPTSDGSGQAIHPSIVKFNSPWNGHLYWMAMTPYPNSNSTYENPEILVSDDGENWEVPNGLSNPIEVTPGVGYNSDTELVYDNTSNKLYCFYRYTNNSSVDTIKIRSSEDGVNWSGSSELFSTSFAQALAPSVVFDGSQWIMFTCTNGGALQRRTATSPSGTWSTVTSCTLSSKPSGLTPWHSSVVFDSNGFFYAFVAEQWDDLYLLVSDDGITFQCAPTPLLQNGGSGWDSGNLYRACALTKGTGFDLWYSARGSDGTWHTGKTIVGRS